jgi:hypothetical protein
MNELYDLLLYIGSFSYYIPLTFVLILLLKNNKYSTYEYLLFLFIIYNGVIIFVEQFILDGKINNFNPLQNIVTIIDFFTIIAIFSKILQDSSRKILNVLKYILVVYFLVCLIELLFVNNLYSINLYSNNLSKALIIIIAGITIYFSEITTEITSSQKIFTYTVFMYSILTLPIALSEQFIRLETSNYFYITWSLNIIFAIFYNLFLTLSLWKLKK